MTSILPSLGNKADNKAFPDLLAHDQALGLPPPILQGLGQMRCFDSLAARQIGDCAGQLEHTVP